MVLPQDGSQRLVIDVLGGAEPRVHDPNAPLLYADDLAAVRGDGIFETLMLRQGEVRNVHRHLTRFRNSAAMLNLPEPDLERWQAATDLAARTFGGGEAALRWVYSRGRESTGLPTGWLTVAPVGDEIISARTTGVKVMTAERGFRLDLSQRSPWALIGAKTLSYAANMAALRAAKERGLDDVIFLSDEGNVLEGPTSSVIVAAGGALYTPPVDAGILPGTSQASLFALAEQRGWSTQQKAMTVPDLLSADGVWLVSSVRIQARVTQLDGRDLPRPDCAAEVEQMATEAVTG
ncbi:aminodeoxychorismate lyase [Corynebacterium heidelbergense]|uniref:Aminodeoxychorismate lyase n=1 Tax=Corynebacterium heidelbergense TaxID=2055947 RepID=A0A364V812_9CORY|nr:aminodeoxychorismate lyase [Corynebacterium heidelbergense]RAV32785.1 aminodeoxychorismate lyase [Corynebacterium heidelbergense]